MATKALCCTAEDERSDSPVLPNARVHEATPARLPLLHDASPSVASNHTSTQSEDVHELRFIFNNAQNEGVHRTPPANIHRTRFGRSSIHSLPSLHKIKSVHALIKRKLSKDLSKLNLAGPSQGRASGKETDKAPDTVLRKPHDGPNLQLKITKEDLRRNLLTDKGRSEGGYDSDAEVLEGIARRIGRPVSKRTSLHSIDWASKTSTNALWNQYCSSPNLRIPDSRDKDRSLRRSHSFSSIERASSSQLQDLLPRMSFRDSDTMPWSAATLWSLQLSSQAPHLDSGVETTKIIDDVPSTQNDEPIKQTISPPLTIKSNSGQSVIRSAESTALPNPLDSNDCVHQPVGLRANVCLSNEDENPRHSVHLYSMRISHHLRSGERSNHHRHTSSSGFGSAQVPSKWGKVISPGQEPEDISSIYSSRPHSPPASVEDSTANLSTPVTQCDTSQETTSSIQEESKRGSIHGSTEATPRPAQFSSIATLKADIQSFDRLSVDDQPALARNNSVADTKRSKFREDFSPSPPRKRSTAALSILKILKPKSGERSQSDTNLKLRCEGQVDGSFDPVDDGERKEQLSQSAISLEKEMDVLKLNPDSDPVWEHALKAFHDERRSMFLPQNNQLSVERPLYRKRSSSVSRRRSMASPNDALRIAFDRQKDDAATVGAWGLYPSHTRPARTGSAGHQDRVMTRDFALETAIKFAQGDLEDDIDPTATPEISQNGSAKRKKKRVGHARMAKSHSMTFGKQFIKNYTRMFRSQSTEFRQHGHGHRSSITTGGMLEYPELEVLPDVWRRGVSEHTRLRQLSRIQGSSREEQPFLSPENNAPAEAATQPQESKAKLNSFEGSNNAIFDGAADSEGGNDRARVWSLYYKNCVPRFPRPSLDHFSLSQPDLGELARAESSRTRPETNNAQESFPSKLDSLSSKTLPPRFKHSRRESRISIISRASIVSSFKSLGRETEYEDGQEVMSVVSVRKSTLDLVDFYQEQEAVARERVLDLTRMGSITHNGGTAIHASNN
ncbi:hypothetical protein BU24DRAFT_479598 [Aaosphaeria arxii CBS 175.79]|uniref:Uncharacterized protein n=1 Tax=Aaosphaeria arxii CBS 175.79 TaxID=1450172 RepID=A0A6A5XY34_9PLEO|nr:uncharacterized protein BU24DRAFT_479598 [Aaosphaeria arxii CBS 175.79]KAF2018218.1 hypothetical protein BU24DRAFT_479598 [Aaosphaeria arxii CBS 175.79]